MRYIVAERSKASVFGFEARLHRVSDKEILLNEKEIIFSQTLTGDFDERVAALGGKIMTAKEVVDHIKGWS